MAYRVGEVLYSTALEAAQAMCRNDFPSVQSISATVTVTTSCLTADQTGLSGDLVRLNLVRASTNATPTAVSIQTRIPQATDLGSSGALTDPFYWVGLVMVMALGYIGGRLR